MSLELDVSWIGTVLEPERTERLEAVRAFLEELTTGHIEVELARMELDGTSCRGS